MIEEIVTVNLLVGNMNMNDSSWKNTERLDLNSLELKKMQFKMLKKQLTRVYDESPYYKEKFDLAGVNPHEFSSLEQYKDYPMFDKYEERESQALSLKEQGHPLGMHLTCNIRDVNRMSASSGTTGTPSFQGHTANDRKIIERNFTRMAKMTGLRAGDKVLMAGVMSMWVAGLPTVDALLSYGANVIPIGGLVGSAKVIEMIQLTRPEVIICTPSFARQLLKKSKTELNIDLSQFCVRKLVVYGEPGGSVPEIVKELSEGFGGAEIFDMSGGTGCLNPIFAQCSEHDGMHFIAPDSAYIELYDRNAGKVIPFEDGAVGEFVYTDFDRECGPLIRFMDGDKMRVNMKPCKCGLAGMRFEILGRVDDMLLIKGVNVFPSAVRDLVMSFQGEVTGNVRIVKGSDSPVIEPPMIVKVECVGEPDSKALAELKQRLETIIQRQLRFKANIVLFYEGELPMEYGATGKIKLLETSS
ncbi:phenylacetate--CoA ligase family protein [Thalassotalea sp. ND16A]|uniref:phenylacetate--CoA ligase family protein n=1 Tax=Thalassotalea sp. ND16A TaxID=1535422 RepID=UPI00051D1E13|nr:AMP-binding protein [Thalassotalea sp. ND16A]KGJ87861.1 Phenylacetate--CoA ligase [Thalassotalea sp. ND16A]